MTRYYMEKKGVLKFAEGHNLKKETMNLGEYKGNSLPWLYRMAVESAPNIVERFHEENGYEYRNWAVYDPETQILTTNTWDCPARVDHHFGSRCPVCGLRD